MAGDPDEVEEGLPLEDDDEINGVEGDGSEAADEPDDEGQDEEQEEVAAAAPSRATKRVQAATQAAKEAQERAARLEKEVQELRSQRAQPQTPQEESDEQFNARCALLTTEERIDAKLDRAERRHQRQLQQATFLSAERADKAAFEARAAYDPKYKRYAEKVEQTLAEERRKGNNFDRSTILRFVIGDAVLANEGKVKTAQQNGQRRIQQQQSRTSGGRGDTAPQRRTRLGQGNSLADIEARLDGVVI
jgi:hypothetical protein